MDDWTKWWLDTGRDELADLLLQEWDILGVEAFEDEAKGSTATKPSRSPHCSAEASIRRPQRTDWRSSRLIFASVPMSREIDVLLNPPLRGTRPPKVRRIAMSEGMIRLYDLRAQKDLIAAMQRTSPTREDIWLAPHPLVASSEWSDAVERGELPRHEIAGVIMPEWWGSMADWSEFELQDSRGDLTTWTREGGARRYAPGLDVRIVYVEHPWKHPERFGEKSQLVV
jgi:hypothetical protein